MILEFVDQHIDTDDFDALFLHISMSSGQVLCSLYNLNLYHAVAGVDYIQDTTTLTFDACEPIMCGTLRALDDCVLEEEETFRITLGVPSDQDPRIKINKGRGDVTIIDGMHSQEYGSKPVTLQPQFHSHSSIAT